MEINYIIIFYFKFILIIINKFKIKNNYIINFHIKFDLKF